MFPKLKLYSYNQLNIQVYNSIKYLFYELIIWYGIYGKEFVETMKARMIKFVDMTYQIDIPEDKTKDVLAILKALKVKVRSVKSVKSPNAETIAAMKELKAGKGRKFKSVRDLFETIK